MRTKTIFIILFTVLITIFLMINTDAVPFNFIFGTAQVSKLVIIGVCTLAGFIFGYIAGRPRTVVSSYDRPDDQQQPDKDELSEEDREYIS